MRVPVLALIALSMLFLAGCGPSEPEPEVQSLGETPPAPAEPAVVPGDVEALRALIAKAMPGVKVSELTPAPVAGLYEMRSGMEFAYISADGRYLLTGDLTDLETRTALTEVRRQSARLEYLATLGDDTYVRFAPATPAVHSVTVFTDIDCGYCRLLHKQIDTYTAQGIEVRYAFFPRSGENTESFYAAEQVWCSADRQQALTDAKAGKKLTGPRDCENPIARHLQAAADLSLRGTPAIILPNGEVIPGYQPAEDLLQALDAIAAEAAAKTAAAEAHAPG